MGYELETKCIHGGQDGKTERPFGAVSTPIFQSATFSHPGIGRSTGYDYSRESNPTRAELERIVASLEGAVDTVACSSGMAAVTLCMNLFESGSHFVCSEDLYGGSVRLFHMLEEQRGMAFSFVDTSDVKQVASAIRENTRGLYIETPGNPMMCVTDLRKMRRLADQHGLTLIVDNTFLTPYFQNPLALGADLVLHSGTKFLSGHNDTLAGFLCAGSQELAERIRFLYKTVGSCLAPFDSFLMIRGIKTLAIRMERAQENAQKIAAWLKTQEHVEQIYYVGLPEHPGYETNQSQSRGFGSMISFRVDSEALARRILEKVRLITYAESLGGTETLITYPMLQTHGDVPKEVRERLGITETFLRLSVGIENADDLIADLARAMS